MSEGKYAGDISPADAWAKLQSDPDTVLVDVRTDAEWTYVGAPNLETIGKETVFAAWVNYPGGTKNDEFIEQVKAAGIRKDQTVLCLCRSGQRSIAAAIALTEQGYDNAYNILEGFEGDKDADGRRGATGGWKKRGLPWSQS
ncbi:MAG TPA: sulfurtransferase [Rhodospirillaceae bacterium]|nr:sulfurtransferase [Rhodospirillaceae bacterium]HAT35544.1 sulfurtransferase [Rhodospirillaceae bacterium]